MKLKWRDFDIRKDDNLDEWLSEDYSTNSILIKEYAGFFNGIVDEVKHCRQRMQYLKKDAPDFVKVVMHNEESVGVVIIKCTLIKKGQIVACVNPIVVNPRLMGQGYGTKMLKNLVKNIRKITKLKISEIGASVDPSNERSLRLFRTQGFEEIKDYCSVAFKKKLTKEKAKRKKKLSKNVSEQPLAKNDKEQQI